MFCNLHEQQPLERVGVWMSEIQAIWGKQQPSKKGGSTTAVRSPATQNSGTFPTETGAGPSSPRSQIPPAPKLPCDPSTYWPKTFDNSPFDIIAKSDKPADPLSAHARIKRNMMEQLEGKDHEDGYVYAYKVAGNSGHVKIGYTTRSIEQRHDEWRFDCNRNPVALYPAPPRPYAVVRNAARVEALCHEELGHRRMKIYCVACMNPHLEWFEVSEADAIFVIQKWSKWMATDPYQPITLRSGVKWTIRDEVRKGIMDMNSFMKKISEAVNSTVKSELEVDDAEGEGMEG